MTGRVAIIGAGISGLACADSLTHCHRQVTVFDKGRGPGGRTSTRRTRAEGSEVAFDHGAQYFTVRSGAFAERVADWQRLGAVSPWHGRIVVLGEDGRSRPSDSRVRFVGTPRMSSICEHLASGLDVRCGVRIGAIRREGRQLCLSDSEGGSLGAFDVVVCSAPPLQTAALLGEIAPAMAATARTVEMGPCWAVMAAFEPTLAVDFDGAFLNHGPLSWVARTSSKPGRAPSPDRWVLHAGPDWSDAHLEDDPDAVADALLAAFFEALTVPPAVPRSSRAHRWRYALARRPLDVGCLWDPSLGVGACGDWANGNRVEGAFLSGMEMATRIVGDLDRA